MNHMTSSSYNGDGGIRTLDLRVANAALSQLSYAPSKRYYILITLEGRNVKLFSRFLFTIAERQVVIEVNCH